MIISIGEKIFNFDNLTLISKYIDNSFLEADFDPKIRPINVVANINVPI